VPGSLWLYVAVDESKQNDWMESEDTEVLRKGLSLFVRIPMFCWGSYGVVACELRVLIVSVYIFL
jgi:hypothetical protein